MSIIVPQICPEGPPPDLPRRNECGDWLYFNTDHWPIVMIEGRRCANPNMDGRFEAFLHCFATLLNHDVSCALIFDIRTCNKFPMKFILPLAQFLNTMKPKIIDNLLCSCIVCTDFIVKGIIQGVFKLHPPSRPNRTTDKLEDALTFAATHFINDYDHRIDQYDGFDEEMTPEQLEQMEKVRHILDGQNV